MRNAPLVISFPEATGDGKGESLVFSCKRAMAPNSMEKPNKTKPE